MNGKGDSPRSCFSKKFRNNYDEIDWGHKKTKRKCKKVNVPQCANPNCCAKEAPSEDQCDT